MSRDTVFRIASMTKPVTSVGIMMLYEEGKLRLDDPAGNYLPAYKGREVMATFNEKDATYTTRPAQRRDDHPPAAGPHVRAELSVHEPHHPRHSDEDRHRSEDAAAAVRSRDEMELLARHRRSRRDHREAVRPAARRLGPGAESFVRWGWSTRPTHPVRRQAARLATIHERKSTGLVENPNPPTYVPDVRGDGGLVSTAVRLRGVRADAAERRQLARQTAAQAGDRASDDEQPDWLGRRRHDARRHTAADPLPFLSEPAKTSSASVSRSP